jgi:hypothetical protein
MIRPMRAWQSGPHIGGLCEAFMGALWTGSHFRAVAAVAAICLTACGSEGPRYSIGGTVSGLAGAGLVLENAGDTLPVSANGAFAFAAALANGEAYAVAIRTHPAGQFCTVAHGSGVVGNAAVTDAVVTCSAAPLLQQVASSPTNAATNVVRTTVPALTFSANLGAATVTSANVTLQSAAGNHVATLTATGGTVTVTPRGKLLPLTTYTLTAGTGLRGVGGEALAAAVTTQFTTRDAAWQPAALLAPSTTEHSFNPAVFMNANGSALVMWRQYGTDLHMWSSRHVPGSGWTPPEMVQTGSTIRPPDALVLDQGGNGIAVWEETQSASCPEDSSCTRYNLMVGRYTASGGWGKANEIASAVAGRPMDPKIAMDAQGNAMLVWAEHDGTRSNIWAKRFAVNGGWGNQERIESASGTAFDAQVAMDAQGNAIAVWTQREGAREVIWSNRYAINGGWGVAVRVETDADSGGYSQIAMNAAGSAVAVWQRFSGTGNGLWANTWSTNGGWGAQELVANALGYVSGSAVAMDATGNAMAIWSDLYRDSGGDFQVAVWASRRIANGGWSTPSRLRPDLSGSVNTPSILMDGAGNAVATWAQLDGSHHRVWTNRYVANQGWSEAGLLDTNNQGDALFVGLAMDESGDAIAVWDQNENGSTRAYFRRFE